MSNINFDAILQIARELGFSAAAFIPAADLVVVPEYRKYCEQNLCGCYNKIPVCPPMSGTVEEMTASFRKFPHALILQTESNPDLTDARSAKLKHNEMSGMLMDQLSQYGVGEHLLMSAGPWKHWSCMSAYCVDAQKMADRAGMLCWAHDGIDRFFSLILF